MFCSTFFWGAILKWAARCRLLNPLTLDLAECGPRARCKGREEGVEVEGLQLRSSLHQTFFWVPKMEGFLNLIAGDIFWGGVLFNTVDG